MAKCSLIALGTWAVVAAVPIFAQNQSRQATSAPYVWLSDPKHWGPTGALIVGLCALIAQLDKVVDFCKKFRPKNPIVTAEDLQHIRSRLLRHLSSYVITRIEGSLNNLVKLDLQMEDQHHWVGKSVIPLVPEDEPPVNLLHRVLRVFKTSRPDVGELNPNQEILEVFNRSDIGGKLLIIGEPGSGKTTEMLTLAKELLIRAQANATLPIPIIFDLSTWKGQPLQEWLVQQVLEKYKPRPKHIAKMLVELEMVLPLLDGLDELGLGEQRHCIDAINLFMQQRPLLKLAVCSRREEYEKGQAQLSQINGAVYLKPFKPKEIEESLRAWKRYGLWENIKKQPQLLSLASTPLFLSMLAVSCQGQSIQNTDELMSTFIQTKLHDQKSKGTYIHGQEPSHENTLIYLRWLAHRLDAEKRADFLIESLQPTWLATNQLRLCYRLVASLFTSLFVGLFYFGFCSPLMFWVDDFSGYGSALRFLGIMLSILTGLAVWFMPILRALEILPSERITFSWREGSRMALYTGFFAGLASGLVSWLKSGLSSGLSSGLTLGLLLGLAIGIRASDINIEEKSRPNEGIKLSVSNSLFLGLCILLGTVLIVVLYSWRISWLPKGNVVLFPLYMLLTVWSLLSMPLLQHLSLRLVLYLSGCSPWNYARFFDHAAKHRFIQNVGGRYRFMHDLLRKHFAALTDEDIKQLAHV